MYQYQEHQDGPEKEPTLCCCEYIDINRERNHMIACCCNCIALDNTFDRLICCRRVSQQSKNEMLLTFQDRLRIPWLGGAKRISFFALLPFFVLPPAILVAALSMAWTCVMIVFISAFMWYVSRYLNNVSPKSKFYLSWNIVSMVLLWVLFESTVPLLEVLPEENFILIVLVTMSCYCFYKTKKRASMNHVVESTAAEGSLPDITEVDVEEGCVPLISNDTESDEEAVEVDPNMCPRCRKYTPPRSFHCYMCRACVLRMDHHNLWLDCCIGQSNHRLYFFGTLFGMCALLFGSNLALTAICHPFLLLDLFGLYIFLPDDCGEVYLQYDVALCFVGSVYAVLLMFCLFSEVLRQFFCISRGLTWQEFKNNDLNQRRNNLLYNWKAFICLYRV